MIVLASPPPADQQPAAVYLARLAPGSRPTMRGALDTIATIAASGACPAERFPWHLVRYAHSQAIRAVLADRYAPATANKMLSALRGVLKEAWRLGLMPVEDYQRAADLQPVRGRSVQKGRALAGDECTALLRVCEDGTPAGVRDAALIAVLYGAGLRRAEAVALDVADYDEADQSLAIRRGKGNKGRIAYLSDAAAAYLARWLNVADDLSESRMAAFCAIARGGHLLERRLAPAAVRFILLRRAKQAGIASFTPHDFRRTFISDLLDAGADLSTVQQLAGHANVATTTRYDRRGERAKRAAANLLRLGGTR